MERVFRFIPRLSKCCCCIPLRFGALIIGYFSLLMSLTLISVACVSLYKFIEYLKDHSSTSNHTTENLRGNAIALYIVHAYVILVFLFCCVINLMLIVGVHRNKLRLIRIYVITALVLLVMDLILVVVTFTFVGFVTTLPFLKYSVILFYFIIVVHSTYLEMQNRQRPIPLELKLDDISTHPPEQVGQRPFEYKMVDVSTHGPGPSQRPLMYA